MANLYSEKLKYYIYHLRADENANAPYAGPLWGLVGVWGAPLIRRYIVMAKSRPPLRYL